jgi:non-ribosomal peptide synthetase component F
VTFVIVPDDPGKTAENARFVHELFASRAARHPGSTADRRRRRRPLPPTAERGAEAIRGLLAIMKAGAGYLPLDPSLPAARLAQICAEARPMAGRTALPTQPLPTQPLPARRLAGCEP